MESSVHVSGGKRSETERYVISNCPIMSRMKPVEP